jgi:drug/metabolite transporter (DMT)-like permease
MNKITLSLVLVIVLSLVGVIGDFFIKLSGSGAKYIDLRWFIIGFVIYAMTAFGWFYVMKNIKLSTLGVFYAISTVLFLLIVGVFVFKEKLNSYEIAGIITAIISLILLGRFA